MTEYLTQNHLALPLFIFCAKLWKVNTSWYQDALSSSLETSKWEHIPVVIFEQPKFAAARVALRSRATASNTTSKLRSSIRQFMQSYTFDTALSLTAAAYAQHGCSREDHALATI